MNAIGRVVAITGGTSGIGLAAAELFAERGDIVYVLARRPFDEGKLPKGVRFVSADVSNESSVVSAFAVIYADVGRIDVLICSAGFGISGAVEFTSLEDAKRQFDVNFFGTFNCARAVLPDMRASGGRIIALGSVAGVLPIPYQAFYSASKAAIQSMTRALAIEVRPFPVSVSALMPGDVKTGFTAARKKEPNGASVYTGLTKSVERMEHDEQNGMPPEALAKRLYSISTKKHPKTLYSCGFAYQTFCVLAGALPVRFVDWALSKLYG